MPEQSLRWDCKHANALECFMVPRHERIWIESVKCKKLCYKGEMKTVWIVINCKNFESDEEVGNDA